MVANLFENIQANQLADQLIALEYQLQNRQQVVDGTGNLTLPALSAWQLPNHRQIAVNETTKQVTFTTATHPTADRALDELTLLNDAWQAGLSADQFTWPYAVPSQLTAPADIALARQNPWAFINDNKITISFSPDFLHDLYQQAYVDEFSDQATFQHALITRTVDRLVMYQWFITYILGNAPLASAGFDEGNATVSRSILTTLAITTNQTTISANADDTGIVFNHLELSGHDLTGISPLTIDFLSIFTLFCATVDNPDPTADDFVGANQLNAYVASEEPTNATVAEQGANALVNVLTQLVDALPYTARFNTVIHMLRNRIQDATQTPAAQLANQAYNGSILSFGRQQAADLKNEWLADNALLPSVADLSTSQQAQLLTLIQKGANFEIDHEHTLIFNGTHYPANVDWKL